MLPQTFGAIVLPFSAAPEELQHRDGGVQARIYFGSAKMLEALGLTLIAGRTFDANSVMPPAADMNAAMGAWAPEMVITKAMADRLFPQGSALGKTVYVGLVNRSATVVGVVERMQGAPLGGAAQSLATQIVLLPIQPFGKSALYVVRTRAGSRDAVMARVEAEFANLRDGRYVRRVESFTTTAANARSGYRSSSIMLGVASFLVVAVALVGIAGLAAFNVTTRTRQLGTRRAVGATRMDVVRYFLVENWLITSGGALLGCALGLAAGMRLSTAYQMPRLPLYYLVAGVLAVWVLGLLAVLVPARRAASIPPAIATRMA
jgi:putative ABC transport system permease protein